MKQAITILITLLIIVLAAVASAYSGWYDVSARSEHSSIAAWYLSTTARASIQQRAADITIPDLDDEKLVLAGISDYEAMCVDCHGAPGKSPAPVGQGLSPAAPALQQSAQEMSTAELFWVTKNGIRMTGMPAWGATHDDQAIWPVIAFLARLPDLDESGYETLLLAASGHGHHSAAPSAAEQPAGEVHVHDDGSSHLHAAPVEVEETEEHEHGAHEH
jgi:mono/diheme cytochrome c family protein